VQPGLSADPAILNEAGIALSVKDYCALLQKNARDRYNEFLLLLNAGAANVRKLEGSGLWKHGENAEINSVDPDALRSFYLKNGRFDTPAIRRDIAIIKKKLAVHHPRLSPELAGTLGNRKNLQMDSVEEALKKRLEVLEHYDQWAFGLCREWAASNFDALAEVRPTLYTVEWVEVMTRYAHIDWGEHNVLRIAEKGREQQAFVFDSWQAPTTVETWPEFMNSCRFLHVSRRYP
jgi:hypothetical protein